MAAENLYLCAEKQNDIRYIHVVDGKLFAEYAILLNPGNQETFITKERTQLSYLMLRPILVLMV